MDIFHLLGKEEDYREHGGGRILSVESPRADLVEEKVKELVDRDIQKHGRSTILGFKSPSNIKLPVTQSPALFTYESTPLIWAACLGRTSLVEFFLSRGADINATGTQKRTALIWAADRGDLETTLCLIKHGADLEAKESTALSTALNWAAWRQRPSIVKALVEAGAVTDTPNIHGNTALDLGVQFVNDNSYEITQILLKAGAQLPQNWNWKVLVKTRGDFNESHFSLVTLLVEYGLPVDETMFDTIRTLMGEEKANQLRAASSHKVCSIYFQCFHFFFSGTDGNRSCKGEQPRNTKHC